MHQWLIKNLIKNLEYPASKRKTEDIPFFMKFIRPKTC